MSVNHSLIKNVSTGNVHQVYSLRQFCHQENISMSNLYGTLYRSINPNRQEFPENEGGWVLIEEKKSQTENKSKIDSLLSK